MNERKFYGIHLGKSENFPQNLKKNPKNRDEYSTFYKEKKIYGKMK